MLNGNANKGGFNEKSIVLQKSVFSFDASIWEIFVCHASGGELFMLNEEASTDIKLQLSIIKKCSDNTCLDNSFHVSSDARLYGK